MTATAFDIGRVLWEARLRSAWGAHADTMIARDPWPPHASHPSMAVAHELAIAEARALLSRYAVNEHSH